MTVVHATSSWRHDAEPAEQFLAQITWDQIKSFFRAESTRLFRTL
jgi:hypothetical protein